MEMVYFSLTEKACIPPGQSHYLDTLDVLRLVGASRNASYIEPDIDSWKKAIKGMQVTYFKGP